MPELPTDSLPLSGVRVIEFCNVAAGPFCAMLLADLGADLIKVESSLGDSLRQWPPLTHGFSENFASLNRNKRSIALNLKDDAERDIARRLVMSADILVENNRPGVMKRLGLGPDYFAESHPDLIYCSLSAYGQSGPRSAGGGFDLTIQAISGIMSVTGEVDREPVKAGVPISDFATGLYGAFAAAAMLHRVRSGGKGGLIDASMLGSSLAISALQVSEYFGTGQNPRALGAAHPRDAPYQAFRAADGNFVMAAGNDKLWKSVCDIIGQPDLVDDTRFRTTTDRAVNQQALAVIMNAAFSVIPLEEVIAALEKEGVPCGRINSYSEALDDKQVKYMNWVQKMELPNGHAISTFGPAVRIDDSNLPIRRKPPVLDGDRATILEELAAIEKREGVVLP